MAKDIIKQGFYAAGVINIGGILIFSRFFSNDFLNKADPLVMSNFGLLMIIIWGCAYMSVANHYKDVPWISLVFAIEKLIYTITWLLWMKVNAGELGAIFSQDVFAGIFFSIYGPNDFLFFLFFGWVFFRSKKW